MKPAGLTHWQASGRVTSQAALPSIITHLEGMNMNMDQLQKIAEKHGVKTSIRKVFGEYYGHINGVSFRISDTRNFERKCAELKNYQPPAPINLTERLIKIEQAYFGGVEQ